MTSHNIIAVPILIFILCLIYISLYFLKKISNGNKFFVRTNENLKIQERIWIDSKRQAIVLEYETRKHLIILSPQHELIVESMDKATEA